MSAYNPPIEDLAIFDPNVFITTTEGLSTGKLDLLYLNYPEAQGTETLLDTIINGSLTLNQDNIRLGNFAGTTAQGLNAIAIGIYAGEINQGTNSIAIGNAAGYELQSEGSIAIGYYSGVQGTSLNSICIGAQAGDARSIGENSVCIGKQTQIGGSARSIAIGSQPFVGDTAEDSIVMGTNSSIYEINPSTIAIGNGAKIYQNCSQSIAIGKNATINTFSSGDTTLNAISIGTGASVSAGGNNSIAFGNSATTSTFSNSVSIGASATCLANNQITLGTTTETIRLNTISPLYATIPSFTNANVGFTLLTLGASSGSANAGITTTLLTTTSVPIGVYMVTIFVRGISSAQATTNDIDLSLLNQAGTIVFLSKDTSIGIQSLTKTFPYVNSTSQTFTLNILSQSLFSWLNPTGTFETPAGSAVRLQMVRIA